MNANLNEANLVYLFKAITTLETVEDCRKFFNYTSCDGYALVFERLKALEEKGEE